MAIKAGTEDKRKVIAVVALLCILVALAVWQFMGDSPTPQVSRPVQAVQPVTVRQAPQQAAIRTAGAGTSGPDARLVANAGLDPALHLEKLALSESIEYAGNGRNIFSADSGPVQPVETALASARPEPEQPAANQPPPKPQPPAIDLKYFGYSSGQSGSKEAFLVHGEDIFEAAAGEIVNHRYKVVAVDAHSVQITDLSYNNTQTLPLVN